MYHYSLINCFIIEILIQVSPPRVILTQTMLERRHIKYKDSCLLNGCW